MNNLFKKLVSLVFVLVVVLTTVLGCSNSKKSPTGDADVNKENNSEIATLVENEKVFLSFKDLVSRVGGEFTFDGDKAVAKCGKDNIEVYKDKKEASLNSKNIVLKESPKVKDGELYVPITFADETIDAKISYNKETNNIDVKTEVKIDYSKSFSVNYLKGGLKKVVDGDKRTLVLVPKGKEVPGEYKNEIVISTPIDNVLLGSTTQACHIRALDLVDSVKGVTTEMDQWRIPEIKEAMENGKIEYVGKNDAPDYEKITTLKPSLAITYSGPSGLRDMMQKLDEVEINYAVCNEYLEENPLGRMEWIKFIGAFYDKEEEATEYFNNTVAKLDEMKSKISGVEKPKVSWGMISKGKVYVPEPDSYVAKMIEMAGGEYVFKEKNIGGGNISLEDFYAKSKEADVLIYSSMNQYSPTLKSVVEQAPILEDIKAVQNKTVWCFHPDYYQSIDKTDELIIDLAAMFHSDIYKDYEVKHYINYKE
ncbi:MAG: ABC transporter substrate-binding protein [Clostridium sp.]|uniref:ABC transporter substrate-binding protein n=1 Tax=Clostridium sp. TaxID=1506 RepID=UPI0030667BCA